MYTSVQPEEAMSLAAINHALQEAVVTERSIDEELETLLQKRAQLELKITQLHASTEEVKSQAGLPPSWTCLRAVSVDAGSPADQERCCGASRQHCTHIAAV